MIYPVRTLTKHILKTPNQLENPTVLKTPETKKARTHQKPKQVESANPWIEISSRFRDPQIKNKYPIFRFRSRNRAKSGRTLLTNRFFVQPIFINLCSGTLWLCDLVLVLSYAFFYEVVF